MKRILPVRFEQENELADYEVMCVQRVRRPSMPWKGGLMT